MKYDNRIFKSPDELLQAWEEYKSYRDETASKWAKVQYVGKEGKRVTDNPPMPYDIDGFYAWYKNTKGRYIHQYFEKVETNYPEFLGIVTHILAERNDNIKTGTLLGFFNASMGNRITGLADKQEIKADEKAKPMFGSNPLADNE